MPTTSFSWALIGPGRIAHRFAEAVHALPDARLACVLGRDEQRTQAFAARWTDTTGSAIRATSQWDDILNDDSIDGIYIATPHAMHADAVQRCLVAGKPVLCEKPLVPNVVQAQILIALAQRNKVFLMEALWTRFLPAYAQISQWLHSGAIGPVRAIQSSFCFAATDDLDSRLYAPELAGGALLIGIAALLAALLGLISASGQTLEIGTFMLGADEVGNQVADTLVAAAARGVHCRVLVDSVGNLKAPQSHCD